ncbi:HAMP domain-containing sensor histidine kinase [uncultured Roseobacter sp.]|uniref:sensor histidine kinase n=1 Tax=uncultured Roseobacter sp. TaxID=114847 RepID=UPI002615CAF8|nr:HAMP domain-containing sensor histidine kinase [uncultured Roseobacter sp.]
MSRSPLSTRVLSLKARLGIGAAILGAGTLVTALILVSGLNEVSTRLSTALEAETRMARYSSLSQQAATFLVITTEMIQSGQSRAVRRDRIAPVTDRLRSTFAQLNADTETAVNRAQEIGLDAQSRVATQSLGLARMQALLENTETGLGTDTGDADELRAYIDSFASGFDPLLSQAVNNEIRFRNEILTGIDDLRKRLALAALVIALVTLALVAAFYLGLVRPQFARLDRLRDAAQRIGQEDFAVALPVMRMDEIGQISAETNRMATALADRRQEVQSEWARLNETIRERTEALRAANATLEEIDTNRRRFFADVSHELRTPLTVILMEAQIGRKSTPEAADAFATIETRAARLNRRIDDLLRIARSDSGQLGLELQDTPLPGLTEQAIAEIRAETENAGLDLRVGAMPQVVLHCDPNWVRQVLVGLMRNAIRHARSGGVVQLSAEPDAEQITLQVIDHGPGIAPDQLPRIFDRFEQGKGADAGKGFGLGLALARWVIEEQGGTITAESPLPAPLRPAGVTGTVISVCLPRATG